VEYLPVPVCPPCSYLRENSCIACTVGDPHPGCNECDGTRLKPIPWYRTSTFEQIAISVATGVITSIVTSYVVTRIMASKR
jgi:hypothetical protein